MTKTRADALALIFELTESEALRRHAQHVAFVIQALLPIADEIGL